MLIATYFALINVVIPQIVLYGKELLELSILVIIMFAGIILLFGAVGFKISNNLGTTVIKEILKGIGFCTKTIIQAIGWIVRGVLKLLPQIYKKTRNRFSKMGLNQLTSSLLASIVTLISLVVII